MFKLLNRFAWLLSLSFGFIVAFVFIGLTEYDINQEDIFFSLILGIIAGFIIKKIIFSKSFIEKRLEFFAESLKKNYLLDNNILDNKKIIEETVLKEEKTVKQEDNLSEKKLTETEKIQQKDDLRELIKQKAIELAQEKIDLAKEEITQKTQDLKNSINYIKDKKTGVGIFFEKVGNYIKDFFSTNLLAKLGGILVFLAVVYFLKGFVGELWEIIGPVGRITIGIIIGFAIYFVGVKLHPKYESEALILMGIGILINYAVILSGRYLVGGNGYLTETTTFLFLILNTIFGVITSLIYKSKTLLIFSFIFAYLNPFIIGAKSSGEPYTLIGYSLIVSLGGLFIAKSRVNLALIIISFILGNLLFLVAPFNDSIGWSAKIILTSILSILTIILTNKFEGVNFDYKTAILYLFLGTYLFIILNLFNSGNILRENLSFVVYNVILAGLFVFTIKLINLYKDSTKENYINIFLFIPLIILIGILFSGNLIFTPFVLIGTLILYLIAFSFISISSIFSYIFFGIFAIFILLFNFDFYLKVEGDFKDKVEFSVVIITSLIFLFSSYYYSLKKGFSNLFSIGTIGTILILFPIIVRNEVYLQNKDLITGINSNFFMNLSIIAIIIFAIANLALPIINSKLLKKENLSNLIIGSLAGALFFAFQIYNFGEIHFPGVEEGFAFLGLAIVYFIEGYFIANKIGFENIKTDTSLQNSFFSFIGISISLFSIAIAFVFSNYPEIITTTWLFEATILYFFYSRNSNTKIFYAATILFLVGLIKFGILLDVVNRGDFKFLISFGVILASFILNLYFINKVEKHRSVQNIHHILHIIGMGIMGLLLVQIIPSTGYGWSMFGISIFITILGSFYAKFDFKFLKIFFLLLIAGFGILHIGGLNYIFWRLKEDNLEYLKVLQYIVFAIIIFNYFIWKRLNLQNNYNKILLVIIGIYSFIISNLFVLDLFEHIFGFYTLTIYWGLIASALLYYGIQKDIIKYRTIGLYFLSLTSVKIFLYDIWQIGDTNARILVFGILGVIFIVISTLYTKKYGDNLLKEFSFKNLFLNKDDKKIYLVNEKIKDIDVSKYKGVKFIFNNGKSLSIRSENLIKITKLITNKENKMEFTPGELKDIYEYIINNYKSQLSPQNYKKILDIIEKFVEFGGKVEFIKK